MVVPTYYTYISRIFIKTQNDEGSKIKVGVPTSECLKN